MFVLVCLMSFIKSEIYLLRLGVKFINVLYSAFGCAEPKSVKTITLSVFLRFRDLRAQKLRVNMLVKSTPGINFINIILLPFCTKVVCAAFLYLNFGFVFFKQKNIGIKAACKMLKKLTS